MTDKERLFKFLDSIMPDDVEFGHISLTFKDDGSALIHIENKEELWTQ